MKFLCLVHIDGEAMAALTPEEDRECTRLSIAYDEDLMRQGKFIAADALMDPAVAKIVRPRGGKVTTTDGPYAETKEHLGGFILIDAADMDEAVRIAAGVPVGQYGSIEVRPVMDLSAG